MLGPDPKGGQARNYDENNVAHREAIDHLYKPHPWVHEFKRRRLLLKNVITGIRISPWATDEVVKEVTEEWGTSLDLTVPVDAPVRSPLMPSLEEFARQGIGEMPKKADGTTVV